MDLAGRAVALDGCAAAVQFHDGSYDCKSQAGRAGRVAPGFLDAVEAVEESPKVLWQNWRAGIGDRDRHPLRRLVCRERYRVASRCIAQRICEQIAHGAAEQIDVRM